MPSNRRAFLTKAAAVGAGLNAPSTLGAQDDRVPNHYEGIQNEILDLFDALPDRKAVKIWAPASPLGPELMVSLNAEQRMFVASTLKSIFLCERLRQLDSVDIAETIANRELVLDEKIWSPGSTIFNPPDLTGRVSERTAMEAMVVHSDNTATDMVLREAGPKAVRSFIKQIGLKNTAIPESTRTFAAYLAGAPNYRTITWEELISIPPGPLAHPFLNNVETLASSPQDLVSFFSRASQGAFFKNQATLSEFRRILLLGDISYLVPFPLGLSVLGKAGYADIPGAHARSIAGAVYFPKRWVYFSMVLNWDSEKANDAGTVRAFYGAIHRSITLIQRRLHS